MLVDYVVWYAKWRVEEHTSNSRVFVLFFQLLVRVIEDDGYENRNFISAKHIKYYRCSKYDDTLFVRASMAHVGEHRK